MTHVPALRSVGITILALLFASAPATLVAGNTFLRLTSDHTDWLGPAGTYLYTPADGLFTVQPLGGNGVQISFSGPNLTPWYSFEFAPPAGMDLVPGIYEGATRYPFESPTTPGFGASSTVGCGTESGRFDVLEAQYDSDGTPRAFAVDFEQHCGDGPPAVFGSIRYNSDVSADPRISVSSSTVYEWNNLAKVLTFWVSLSAPVGAPVSVDYRTVDDTAKAGVDYTPVAGTVTFAAGETAKAIPVSVVGDAIAQPTRSFFLSLSNPTGAPIGFGQAVGTILDDTSGRTYIRLDSDSDDWLGAGKHMTLTPADGGISVQTAGSAVLIHYVSTDPSFWELYFSAPAGQPLKPGIYEGAVRYAGVSSIDLPSFDVFGEHRGSNVVTGRFLVLQAEYDSGGNIQKLAVDFELHSESLPPALFGSVRYNSFVGLGSHISVASSEHYEGNGEAEDMTFWVSLSAPAPWPVTVEYATADGTAAGGVDYIPLSGAVTFQPGETTARVNVPLLGNVVPQPDRVFSIGLSNPVGLAIAFGNAIGTIVDDDALRTFIVLRSEPDDWVGQGKQLLLRPLDGPILASPTWRGVTINSLADLGWEFNFGAPGTLPPTPGSYANAARFASANNPGMDVWGEGRGCDETSGQFDVLEAQYGENREVKVLAIDFQQHCEGRPPTLRGWIRFNSAIPMRHVGVTPTELPVVTPIDGRR